MDGLGPINLDILLNNPELLASLERGERDTQNSTAAMQRMASQTSTSLDSLAKKAAAAAAGYFSLAAAKGFIQKLVEVRGEFEQLNVAYTTMLGSQAKANALFQETLKLAETTPFSLTQVAQSTKQLLAYGFSAEEVTGTLSKLGDVAAGVSAPIGDIAYLYGTLRVQGRAYAQDIRQFTGRGIPIIQELAKQFDTTEANVNKLVEAGKVGFPEIEKAFNSITGAGGQFFHLMDGQSKTVTGQISNLGDAFDQVLNDIGASNEGLITGTLSGVSSVLENYEKVLDILKLLIVTYGAYKAAVITTDAFAAFSAARQVTENVQRFNGASFVTVEVTRQLTVAQTLQAGAANVAGKAYDFLNKSMLANPYVALTIGFAAMAYQLYEVSKKTNYAAEASENYVEAMGKEQFKLGELFQKLEETKPGTEERRKSIVALKNAYGEYLPKMDLEKANLADLKKAYGEVNQKITENISLKSKGDQTQKLYDDFGKRYAEITKKITAEVEDISGSAQAGAAAVMVDRLINEALTGKTFLGAGFRGSNQGGSKLMEQAQKYRLQLSGKKDLSETGGLGEYLNQLQIVVDQQRQAQAALNQFYGGVEKATSTGQKDLSAAQKAALLFIERLKEPVKNFDLLLKTASSKEDLDKLKKTLEEKRDALAPSDKEIGALQARVDKVKAVLAVYDPKAQTKAANAEESEFLKRKRLFDKIGELQEQSLSNAKSADEQEVDQVKQKYDKILREIENYNRKAKVKIDPKNIKLSNGVVLDIPQAEQSAEDDVRAQQQVKKQQETLNQQKSFYDEFEAYKKQVNADTAAVIYSQDLKGFTTYVGYLENELKKLDGKNDAYSNAYRDVLNKELPKAKVDDEKRQSQDFLALLSGAQTYEQQRQKIVNDGLKAASDLRSKGYEQEAQQAIDNAKKQLTILDDGHINQINQYKDLYDGIVKLSKAEAEKRIKYLNEWLDKQRAANLITEEAYNKYKKQLNDTSISLSSKNADDLLQVANALAQVATEATGVNEAFGNMIHGLAGIVQSVGNVNKLEQAFKAAKGTQDEFAAGASLVAAGLSSAFSLVNIFTSSAAQRKQAEEAYYSSVLKFQNDYNISLNDEIRLRTQLNSNVFTKDYKGKIIDGTNALVDANKKYYASLEALNQGQAKIGQRNKVDPNAILKGAAAGAALGTIIPGVGNVIGGVVGGLVGAIGGLFGGKKKADVFGGLLTEYPELIKKASDGTKEFNDALAKSLIANNLVDEKTKALLQNTIDLAAARKAALEQINGVISDLAGSLGDDLRNSLVDAFEEGSNAAKAFGDDVSKVIENIVSQFLFQDVFGSQFDELQKQMKASFDIGGDQSFVDDIVKFYQDAAPLLGKFNEGLKAAQDAAKDVGLDVFTNKDNKSNSSSLSGAIKGQITADQANVIEGTLRGMQSMMFQRSQTQIEQLSETRSQTLHLIEIAANTKRTADNTNVLPGMVSVLEGIEKNTKDSTAGILRGQGKT